MTHEEMRQELIEAIIDEALKDKAKAAAGWVGSKAKAGAKGVGRGAKWVSRKTGATAAGKWLGSSKEAWKGAKGLRRARKMAKLGHPVAGEVRAAAIKALRKGAPPAAVASMLGAGAVAGGYAGGKSLLRRRREGKS